MNTPWISGRDLNFPDLKVSNALLSNRASLEEALDRNGYLFLLGMRGGVEYKVQLGPHVATPTFMHCNDRDLSVAFGIGPSKRRINHLMIEVDNLDDVGLTEELVRGHKIIPVTVKPGKHSNDHMYSFYFRNPSG